MTKPNDGRSVRPKHGDPVFYRPAMDRFKRSCAHCGERFIADPASIHSNKPEEYCSCACAFKAARGAGHR